MKVWRKIRVALELLDVVEDIREEWRAGGRDELLRLAPMGSHARTVLLDVDRGVELVERFRRKDP